MKETVNLGVGVFAGKTEKSTNHKKTWTNLNTQKPKLSEWEKTPLQSWKPNNRLKKNICRTYTLYTMTPVNGSKRRNIPQKQVHEMI